MKPKRLILLFGPFACIVLCALLVRMFQDDIPHARTEGDVLNIASLSENEEIVVEKLFSHRNVFARQYRISASGTSSKITVISLDATWESGHLKLVRNEVLGTHLLSPREAEGLDEVVNFFRSRREEHSSAERHYRLTYFRSGKQIGEEFFVGFSLPDHLTYFWEQGYRDDPAYDADYTKMAREYGLTREEIDRMVPFEMLEAEMCGRAPKTTRPKPRP